MNFSSLSCDQRILANCFFLSIGCFCCSAHGENEMQILGKMEEGMENCPVSYIMDAIVDSIGQVWVVSEGEGVWRKSVSSIQWENMVSRGFPKQIKNCYALAEDGQGRIWIGTDHEGVLVWNGKLWRQYTQVDGPIGERIFDIEVNKKNGVVALATSGGLTLYDSVKDSWTDLTREDGLYSDQINSIAFDEEGTMYAGYQCGGVGISLEKAVIKSGALNSPDGFGTGIRK